MDVYLFGVVYLAVALLVGLYAYFRGVVARPVPHIFSFEDRVVVALASIVIGLIWVLFTPVLAARGAWLTYRWLEDRWTQLLLHLPKAARRAS